MRMAQSKSGNRALIITAKVVASAPRVLRELSVLADEGWNVDTVGYGAAPKGSSKHYQLLELKTFERFLSYLLPSNRWRFELTLGRRFRNLEFLELSNYDLIILHEPSVFPLRELEALSPSAHRRFHVDLHENHLSSLSRTLLEQIVFGRYREWELRFLDVFARDFSQVATFSSCSQSISALYATRWGCKVETIRNAPSLAALKPSKTGSVIKLVHHGVGTRD